MSPCERGTDPPIDAPLRAGVPVPMKGTPWAPALEPCPPDPRMADGACTDDGPGLLDSGKGRQAGRPRALAPDAHRAKACTFRGMTKSDRMPLVSPIDGAPTVRDPQELRPGPWSRPLVGAHLEAVRRSPESWPPVVVMSDGVIVDGHHRVAAAVAMGLGQIRVEIFAGGLADAWVHAAKVNTRHGLSWTQQQRRAAVVAMLTQWPDWSNRRIAATVGVSEATVRRARQLAAPDAQATMTQSHASATQSHGLDGVQMRVGRDGRQRPSTRGAISAAVHQALDRNEGASSRDVARAVGASPSYVAHVRRQRANDSPVRRSAGPRNVMRSVTMRAVSLVVSCRTLSGRLLHGLRAAVRRRLRD